MTFRIIRHTAVCLGWALLPGLVLANDITPLAECDGPVVFDGRDYEIVAHEKVSWGEAKSAAGAQGGHLATITSAAEDAFLEALRRCARNRPVNPLTRDAVWVGGFQDQQAQATCETDADPNGPDPAHCGWQWLNDDGLISTRQIDLNTYQNWLEGEPNNYQGKNEAHLTIGHNDDFGWNDEGNLNNIGGYIIEHPKIVDPNECIGGGGCPMTTDQSLVLPPVTLDPDAAIEFKVYEVMDDPARCGVKPLVLFDGADPRPELHIPPYLCGSPQIRLVLVKKSGFDILQGTIEVKAQPLPGNLYACDGPIDPDDPHPNDPQKRDGIGWQATNYKTMRENDLGAKVDPQLLMGAAGEFTTGCSSSRGLTMNASYLISGVHVSVGLDYGDHSDEVHRRFVDLARYKLLLLQQAIEESRPALKTPGEWTSLQAHARNALRAFDQGDFPTALARINLLLEHVENSTYTPVKVNDEYYNYHGEHVARGENLRFSLETRVIPYAP
jgi:hypothetical protein